MSWVMKSQAPLLIPTEQFIEIRATELLTMLKSNEICNGSRSGANMNVIRDKRLVTVMT